MSHENSMQKWGKVQGSVEPMFAAGWPFLVPEILKKYYSILRFGNIFQSCPGFFPESSSATLSYLKPSPSACQNIPDILDRVKVAESV